MHLGNEATAILPHPLGATLVLGLERLRFDGWSEEFGAPDTHESTSLALAPPAVLAPGGPANRTSSTPYTKSKPPTSLRVQIEAMML